MTKRPLLKISFIFIGISLITVNLYGLFPKVIEIMKVRSTTPQQPMAYQFRGLEEFTKDFDYMGYYTDRDLKKDPEAAEIFSQAQYWLAPTILDPEKLSYEYILLVCSDEEIAWKKIEELRALPLKRNQFGMILARRPQ